MFFAVVFVRLPSKGRRTITINVFSPLITTIWKNALSGQEKEVRFRCAHEKERG